MLKFDDVKFSAEYYVVHKLRYWQRLKVKKLDLAVNFSIHDGVRLTSQEREFSDININILLLAMLDHILPK